MNHISAKDLYLDYYIKNSQNLTVKKNQLENEQKTRRHFTEGIHIANNHMNGCFTYWSSRK